MRITLAHLRKELKQLEDLFWLAGGRGIELAEHIDELRAEVEKREARAQRRRDARHKHQ